MRTTAVITVKRLGAAKQRLGEALGPGSRAALAQAMFFDVLAALRRAHEVAAIVVVTGDLEAAEIASSLGARVVDDPADAGQSAAAQLGIAAASHEGAERVLVLPGDCPLLDATEIDELLQRTGPDSVVIVPDRHGTGTNGLLLHPPDAIAPAFGEGSCERHRGLAAAAGITHAVERLASLELDLDTPDDLEALTEKLEGVRGRAARTQGVVRQMRQIGGGATPPPRVVA